MKTLKRAHLLALTAIALALPGCASMRGANVGTDNTATARIEVVNQLGRSMNISWSDGSGEKALGSVAAGRTEQFVIAGARTTSVTVMARDAAGSTSRSFPVDLAGGGTQRVTVR